MEVIPDELDNISDTAKKLSDLVGPDGFVFSSGGIGPTHDDMTYDVRPQKSLWPSTEVFQWVTRAPPASQPASQGAAGRPQQSSRVPSGVARPMV